MISERQLATLRDLSTGIAAANTEPEVLAAARANLGADQRSLPFTLTYLYDGDALKLAASERHRRAPRRCVARAWPEAEALVDLRRPGPADGCLGRRRRRRR